MSPRASLLALALTFGCAGDTTPPAGSPPPRGPQGPPNPQGPQGPQGPAIGLPNATAEDLTSSWRPALGVAVPTLPAADGCPDVDGDGFPSAVACPTLPIEQADCDDENPTVTPAVERWVRPGPFVMGSASAQAGADEQPVHVVQLSGYCLDRDEATTDEVAAWRGVPPPKIGSHAADDVTFDDARSFCGARGKALPTEAQWEKAARGGCEGGADPGACDAADLRAYPWGAELPSCARANHQESTAGMPRLCVSDTVAGDALPGGAGPYGHRHLAGNAWEWVADTWHPAVYTDAPRTDPGGPVAGGGARAQTAEHGPHGLRGGSWNTFSTNMRAANRFTDLVAGSATGVRCARPTVPARPDAAPPLALVALSGTITSASDRLAGDALYVTAFDAADLDPRSGALPFGRSPVAEVRLTPSGAASQTFSLQVPQGRAYVVNAALDAGTGGRKDAYVPASGSGGVGEATQNPVRADVDVTGLTVRLAPPPAGGPPPPR